jgi:N-dimethylarginine dimethylaminohydrolase
VYAPDRALVLRNDGPRGDYEPTVFKSWLAARGFAVEALPPGLRMDGGNLLRLASGDVVAGLKPHALGRPETYLGKLLRLAGGGGEVSTVRLVDRRYLHLDTVVGVLRDDLLLAYRGGLLDGRLPDSGPLARAEVIEVDHEDARRFACNVVVVGDLVITGPISDRLAHQIAARGFEVERLDLSEFYKAGGGAKCLTLPLWPLGARLSQAPWEGT